MNPHLTFSKSTCIFACKVVSSVDPNFSRPLAMYRGENAAEKFVRDLQQEATELLQNCDRVALFRGVCVCVLGGGGSVCVCVCVLVCVCVCVGGGGGTSTSPYGFLCVFSVFMYFKHAH